MTSTFFSSASCNVTSNNLWGLLYGSSELVHDSLTEWEWKPIFEGARLEWSSFRPLVWTSETGLTCWICSNVLDFPGPAHWWAGFHLIVLESCWIKTESYSIIISVLLCFLFNKCLRRIICELCLCIFDYHIYSVTFIVGPMGPHIYWHSPSKSMLCNVIAQDSPWLDSSESWPSNRNEQWGWKMAHSSITQIFYG